MTLRALAVFVTAFILPSSWAADTPATTAFTYQGTLAEADSPATGPFDLEFRLFDAALGGVQIGPAIVQSSVPVTNGRFTTSLNFGASTSTKRFLQVAVRRSGVGSYQVVLPRQELTATPLAAGLVLPWTVVTPQSTGIDITAQFIALTGTSTSGFGAGVIGVNSSPTGNAIGVWGDSKAGLGVNGYGGRYGGYFESRYGTGVAGFATQTPSLDLTNPGVKGSGLVGVRGDSGYGGSSSYGVYGTSTEVNGTGVYGEANFGSEAYAIWGKSTSGYAGYFSGNVRVNGLLSKSGGSFRIDHPLDPANKFLSHSFVESPDMMNIYNGNVVTDQAGYARIVMPDWFEALNRDFRYQLTVIDSADSDDFVQAKVVREMHDRVFVIRTSKPGVKVSWQVTGIRQDAWANANRIPVEEAKPRGQAGRFSHPELFGMPPEKGLEFKPR